MITEENSIYDIKDILINCNQELIFKIYFNFEYEENKRYKNHFRDDKRGSCVMYYDNKGILYFKDWVNKGYNIIDMFLTYGLSYLDPKINKINAVKKILLSYYNGNISIVKHNTAHTLSSSAKFYIKLDRLHKPDFYYLNKIINLNEKTISFFNILSVNRLKIINKNNKVFLYIKPKNYSLSNDNFKYYNGCIAISDLKTKFKAYFYNYKESRYKFKTNINFIYGLEYLNNNYNINDKYKNIVIITKFKEVWIYREFGLKAIALNSEYVNPKTITDLVNELNLTNKIILVNFDKDDVGRMGYKVISEELNKYNINCHNIIINNYKDLCDIIIKSKELCNYKIDKLKKCINSISILEKKKNHIIYI